MNADSKFKTIKGHPFKARPCEAKIIDGKKWAKLHEEKLKVIVGELKKVPHGVNMLIGDDPTSVLYTQIKENKAQELGINFETKKFVIPLGKWETVVEEIKRLNNDPEIEGIMVQLPLPEEFLNGHGTGELLQVIDPQKDIDGLTGKGSFPPAAVESVLLLLKDEQIEVQNKKVVVVGASDLVGKPAAKELEKLGAIVEICNSKTENLASKTLSADILVTATGVPGLITGEMVKDGAVVLDVGAEKVDGKLLGDVDFDSVYLKASKITPVPGGVGPMTVITLMQNVVKLVKER